MMKRNACAAALLLIASATHAEEGLPPVSADARAQRGGADAWLELQRSGQSASPQRQAVSGEAMSRIYQRYLKSYEHPVPMYLQHEQVLVR